MSYIDFIELAASRARDFIVKLHPVRPPSPEIIETELRRLWETLEMLAKNENYDVLECSSSLRTICEATCAWLYCATGSDVQSDVEHLRVKDAQYGGSWQKRGGPGAFFAAARKWDRLEQSIKTYGSLAEAFARDTRPEGILDDVGDLRRYLVLWEGWRLDLESRHVAVKGPDDPGCRFAVQVHDAPYESGAATPPGTPMAILSKGRIYVEPKCPGCGEDPQLCVC